MLKKLQNSPFLKAFRSCLEHHPSLCFEVLPSSAKALMVADLIKNQNYSIVLISGREKNDHLLDDVRYFLGYEALEFPAWETLPTEEIKPSSDIIGKRFDILHELQKNSEQRFVVTSLQGCLQKLISQDVLSHCLEWHKGQTVDFNSLEETLTSLGYKRCSITTDKGEFSLRGGILDIFPMGAFTPFRVDFFDDIIDQIKTFDPISQKSIEKAQSIYISHADEQSLIHNSKELKTLFDYFEKPPLIIFDDILALEDRFVSLSKLVNTKHKSFMNLQEFFQEISPNKTLYFAEDSFEKLFQNLSLEKQKAFDQTKPQKLSFNFFNHSLDSFRIKHPFVKIEDFYSYDEACSSNIEYLLKAIEEQKDSNTQVYFLTSNDAETHSLKDSIEKLDISLKEETQFEKGYLTTGFILLDLNIAVIPFTEFSKRYKVRRKKWRTTYHTPASDFHELQPGDLVVHFHNGIGKYLGIEKQKNHLGNEEEFLIIEYANSSKLYVPLSQSHLISRYIGSHDEKPSLNTLGTTKWQTAKAKAQKSILGYAKDLLHMQAEREAKGGFAFPEDSEDMLLFEEEFPFTETKDQLRAIADIKLNMQSEKAMDRLICGDVGYGKTEVAMRAAFKAVVDGKKQVAVLVPTTTLAMQHYETFCQRMGNFPINIKVLSRFVKSQDIKKIIEDTKIGGVDILIGTHRLISKDVTFKDLGLIIIDEEQRFGVRAKESLKKAKVGVDCLTLSATPIPRTLYMSVIGARDLSVINTPPHDRLPIKTIIAEQDGAVIKNALLRELARDGQAYFIHNRVESIHKIKQELETLVPSAHIKIVHGQQSSKEIDETFHAFKTGTVQVLLATTIVESGIDIPNANTILINQSQSFGLADLYQLRGRVGRWNRPAYCYFLVPSKKVLSETSQKRLYALAQTSGFGGGMKLALRDLEIRGAGDILGTQQSGQVSTVGFHLYCKMLKKAVESIKTHASISFIETKIESKFPACLPENYIQETSLRLEIYHRLGDVTTKDEIKNILNELTDRFGKLPEEVLWLAALTEIKVLANRNYFTLLKFEKNTLQVVQQKGKKLNKKIIPLPSINTPHDLIQFTSLGLNQHFKIKN